MLDLEPGDYMLFTSVPEPYYAKAARRWRVGPREDHADRCRREIQVQFARTRMMLATNNALIAATTAWAQASGNCKICINDSALPYGGKFDIRAIKEYTGTSYPLIPGYGKYLPWTSPHSQHDRGSAVDISSGGTSCSYPVNAEQFVRICARVGFGAINVYSFNEDKFTHHVHCGLAVSFPRRSCDSQNLCQ